MRRRNNHPAKAIILLVFSAIPFTIIACKGRSETTQPTGVFQTSTEYSEMDAGTKDVAYYIFVPGIAYLFPF